MNAKALTDTKVLTETTLLSESGMVPPSWCKTQPPMTIREFWDRCEHSWLLGYFLGKRAEGKPHASPEHKLVVSVLLDCLTDRTIDLWTYSSCHHASFLTRCWIDGGSDGSSKEMERLDRELEGLAVYLDMDSRFAQQSGQARAMEIVMAMRHLLMIVLRKDFSAHHAMTSLLHAVGAIHFHAEKGSNIPDPLLSFIKDSLSEIPL